LKPMKDRTILKKMLRNTSIIGFSKNKNSRENKNDYYD
jgi:hypothetical protein